MPIYEYRCDECSHLFEEWSKKVETGDAERACPLCRGKARRIISNTSFALKGDGWYMTDYGTLKNREKRDNCKDSDACPAKTDCGSAACASAATDAAPATPAPPPAASPAVSSAAAASPPS
ncbi:MAG: zinc ribbon domain-containing protein [Desulfovibrio sp.]|nr:zinc ribbon domain-containing protein [Desulfovibrio sp.]